MLAPSQVLGPGDLSPVHQGSKRGRSTGVQSLVLWMDQNPDGKRSAPDAWPLEALAAVRRQLQRERVSSQQLNFDSLSGSVGDDAGAAPVFLRKTYRMIDGCPPELGGWSDAGDTFVVKDQEAFSLMQIPQYFRHNNFSSFVRQLNFYGFRKVKTDQHGLQRTGSTPEGSKVPWKESWGGCCCRTRNLQQQPPYARAITRSGSFAIHCSRGASPRSSMRSRRSRTSVKRWPPCEEKCWSFASGATPWGS